MTYLGLNLLFVAVVLLASIPVRKQLPWKAIGLATGVLLIATAIFDNLIVGTGIVAYDEELITGIKLGYAPIEDFAYSLVAPLLISVAIEITRGLRWRP